MPYSARNVSSGDAGRLTPGDPARLGEELVERRAAAARSIERHLSQGPDSELPSGAFGSIERSSARATDAGEGSKITNLTYTN
jgi:hypothetical protein